MKRESRESGVALAVALLVLFLVALCLALIALSLYVRMRAVRDESMGIILRALSDAALAEGLANLAADASSDGVKEHPFGGGRIGSRISSRGDNRYRIVATARLGARARTVLAQALRSPESATADVTSWRVLPRSAGENETGSTREPH